MVMPMVGVKLQEQSASKSRARLVDALTRASPLDLLLAIIMTADSKTVQAFCYSFLVTISSDNVKMPYSVSVPLNQRATLSLNRLGARATTP